MTKEYQELPLHKNDRFITNWDYDEYGRWGQKQYMRCILLLISMYAILFYCFYYLWFLGQEKHN